LRNNLQGEKYNKEKCKNVLSPAGTTASRSSLIIIANYSIKALFRNRLPIYKVGLKKNQKLPIKNGVDF